MASKEFLDSLKPMTDCPRWHRCSAPICPLDPKMPKRGKAIGDSASCGVKEPECRLPKAKRMELGKDLPWRGLWPRELAGLKQWERRAPKERRQFIVEGKKNQFAPVSQR